MASRFPQHGDVLHSVAHWAQCYGDNAIGTFDILEACAAPLCVIHIVVFSSAAVYAVPARMPINETSALAPISPFGASKVMAERMVTDIAAAHEMSAATLRCFHVAGAGPEGRAGHSRESRHLDSQKLRDWLPGIL